MKNGKTSVFDWNNFYSEHNAKIIENILDQNNIKLEKILNMFFPNKLPLGDTITSKIAYSRIKTIIEGWKHDKILPYRYNEIFQKSNKIDFEITKDSLLKNEIILSILINEKMLPTEIRLLPRDNKINFTPTGNSHAEYVNLSSEEIVKLPENYIDTIPPTLTYEEAKKRFSFESELTDYCLKNKLGAYLLISDDCVCTTSKKYLNGGYISEYHLGNCGNPNYLKRYRNLERLLTDHLEELWVKKSKELKYHLLNTLQATDIESKFHIERTLKSFNGKNKIEITDLVFIEEEIEKLIIKEEAITISSIYSEKAALSEPISQLTIEEEAKKMVSNKARQAALKSKRLQKNKKLKEEAIRIFNSKSLEIWKSYNQASIKIAELLHEFAIQNNLAPLSEQRAQKTVYDWLRKFKSN